MTSSQKSIFMESVERLQQLTENNDRIQRKIAATKSAIQWYKTQTGQIPPSMVANSDIWGTLQHRASLLSKQVAALNFAYSQMRTQKAAVVASTKFPGDFDVVTNEMPVPKDITANLYRRETFGFVQLAPFIPLMIKAGTVIITAVLAYGCVDAVTETIKESNQQEAEVNKIQADIEKDVSKSPGLMKAFAGFKKAMKGDWFSQLSESLSGGGMVTVALILAAGLMLFNMISKKGGEK